MRGNLVDKSFLIVPLLLYAVILYCSMLWFLYPLFLASCFYALSIFSSRMRFLSLISWCSLAASIMIFPCLFELYTFYSLAAFLGALFLWLAASLSVCILLASLLVVKRIKIEPLLKLLVWSSLFTVWWWFVATRFFTIVGVPCGYVIANPVLCCAASPSTCVLAGQVGMYGLLALHLIAVGGCVFWWVYASRASGIVALGVVIILLVEALRVPCSEDISSKINSWNTIYAFKLSDQEKGVLQTAFTLQKQFLAGCNKTYCERGSLKNGALPELIIGPESCLPCALNKEPSLCRLFDTTEICPAPLVLIGARREEEYNEYAATQWFNSLFILHKGRIIFHYDKKFPLPYLETSSSLPPSFTKVLTKLQGLFSLKQRRGPASTVQDLFLSQGKTPYALGTGGNKVVVTLGGVTYQAYCALCSDFFCTQKVFLKKKRYNSLMIVLVNDSWFYGDAVANHMHRYAVLWAVQQHIPVLYVGYRYASWIEPTGRVWSLATLNS